jgi:dynein heavy chain
MAEKDRLQQESDKTAKRLQRAEKLTSGLKSEGERWQGIIKVLATEKVNLIGDCFLACACISYYGAFTGPYRDELVKSWRKEAEKLGIPSSPSFSLANTLGDPVKVREWQNQGLPSDDVSVCNGILVSRCTRWPLMIDPQQQANAWIRQMGEPLGLQITTMRDPNLLRTLESCIRLGRPLLLEDLGETLEPALEPVLQKAVFKQGSRLLIRLGDSDVDYNNDFKLYMTTKLPNPHYLPDASIKVRLINFIVTLQGLEDQLLGEVVKIERPEVEERRVELLLQMAEDKRQLQQLEANILKMLSESQGNILDDEELINILAESKITSATIATRVAEAEVTEVAVNKARGGYSTIATRGSLLYFVVADLAVVDPMYQYSLSYYRTLFSRCVVEAVSDSDLATRLQNILSHMTLTIFRNICRGLFEKDKMLFASSICFAVMRHSGKIYENEWNLFLRGPGVVERTEQPNNPCPGRISAHMWDLLYAVDTKLIVNLKSQEIEGECKNNTVQMPFRGICESLIHANLNSPEDEWCNWLSSEKLLTSQLPEPFNKDVNSFQRLILVRALAEDRLQKTIDDFVRIHLGKEFAESPAASMEEIYRDLTCTTPCIFVLSTGADPTGMLLRFARQQGYGDRLSIVSLGQGQVISKTFSPLSNVTKLKRYHRVHMLNN